jgi:hypothetical protein
MHHVRCKRRLRHARGMALLLLSLRVPGSGSSGGAMLRSREDEKEEAWDGRGRCRREEGEEASAEAALLA